MSGSQLTRRSLFALLSQILMASGLVGAYGVLASFFARFLYPTRSQKQWYFLATLSDFPVGRRALHRGFPGRRSGSRSATEDSAPQTLSQHSL